MGILQFKYVSVFLAGSTNSKHLFNLYNYKQYKFKYFFTIAHLLHFMVYV